MAAPIRIQIQVLLLDLRDWIQFQVPPPPQAYVAAPALMMPRMSQRHALAARVLDPGLRVLEPGLMVPDPEPDPRMSCCALAGCPPPPGCYGHWRRRRAHRCHAQSCGWHLQAVARQAVAQPVASRAQHRRALPGTEPPGGRPRATARTPASSGGRVPGVCVGPSACPGSRTPHCLLGCRSCPCCYVWSGRPARGRTGCSSSCPATRPACAGPAGGLGARGGRRRRTGRRCAA